MRNLKEFLIKESLKKTQKKLLTESTYSYIRNVESRAADELIEAENKIAEKIAEKYTKEIQPKFVGKTLFASAVDSVYGRIKEPEIKITKISLLRTFESEFTTRVEGILLNCSPASTPTARRALNKTVVFELPESFELKG